MNSQLLLKTSLLNVLGAENHLYSFKEVLVLFKQYVFNNKHLIDTENPSKINCSDDALGKTLGVDSFSVGEAKMLLSKCVFPVPMPENLKKPGESQSQPSTSTDEPSSQASSITSRFGCSSQTSEMPSHCRNSYCSCRITFAVPEIPTYNSENETVYSYQGYDTAPCEDDYEAESCHSDTIDMEEEYEPVTDVDEQLSGDTESDAVSFISAVLVGHSDDFNEASFADESDSLWESDKSLTEDEADKRTCPKCGVKNRPYMPNCLRCWQERKEWFPERPHRRRRRKSRPKGEKRSIDSLKTAGSQILSSGGSEQVVECSVPSGSITESLTSQDSGVVSSINAGCSQDSMESTCRRGRDGAIDSDVPPIKYKMFGPKDLQQISRKFRKFSSTSKGRKWLKSNRADDLRERLLLIESDSETEIITHKFRLFASSYSGRRWLQSSTTGPEFMNNLAHLSSDSESESDRKCNICWCKVANASIIHGTISHLGFCYTCAKRLIDTKSRCPACRRKIDRITKNCYV